jgi:hypothetical protein
MRWSSVTDIPTPKKDAYFYKRPDDYNSIGAGLQATDKRVQDGHEFDNYSIEWRSLLDDLLDVIRSRKSIIKSIIKSSKPSLVYGVAWKLRNFVWVITGFFDTPNI